MFIGKIFYDKLDMIKIENLGSEIEELEILLEELLVKIEERKLSQVDKTKQPYPCLIL